jgi:hypothetical protein
MSNEMQILEELSNLLKMFFSTSLLTQNPLVVGFFVLFLIYRHFYIFIEHNVISQCMYILWNDQIKLTYPSLQVHISLL